MELWCGWDRMNQAEAAMAAKEVERAETQL
jgi:hypothetical protein